MAVTPNPLVIISSGRHGDSKSRTRKLIVIPTALYDEIVSKVNSTLSNFETMKRFRVVADEWALDTGELTPSMKLKRRIITERYGELIAGLYADEATSRGA